MSEAVKLTAQGAVYSIPDGNAIVTTDANGAITTVDGSVIPPKAIARSTVTPQANSQWLRVAECDGAPFFAILSVIGRFAYGHGDGSPTVISFGGSASSNLGYIQSRIQAIVKSETVSKCRAVISGNRIYIDLLFAKGGGLPTIGLIGAIGVNLLTPSIAPEAPDPAKVYSYEL